MFFLYAFLNRMCHSHSLADLVAQKENLRIKKAKKTIREAY